MLASISFIVPEMVACGGAQIAIFLACVAGAKRGGGGWREKSAKEGKRKGSLPSFPNPSLFFPSRLPFSRRVKQKQKKSVCSPPLQAPGWGIQEEICCNWLNTVNKSVKQENDSQLTNSGKSQPCITWIVTLSPIDHSRKYHYIPSCSLFFTPKFCISIVFTFSWELKWPQEKLKTIYKIWRWPTKKIMVCYGIFWSGQFRNKKALVTKLSSNYFLDRYWWRTEQLLGILSKARFLRDIRQPEVTTFSF